MVFQQIYSFIFSLEKCFILRFSFPVCHPTEACFLDIFLLLPLISDDFFYLFLLSNGAPLRGFIPLSGIVLSDMF
jgi:hypothetical protein